MIMIDNKDDDNNDDHDHDDNNDDHDNDDKKKKNWFMSSTFPIKIKTFKYYIITLMDSVSTLHS